MKVNNPKILKSIKSKRIRVNRRAIKEANKPTEEQFQTSKHLIEYVARRMYQLNLERFLRFIDKKDK